MTEATKDYKKQMEEALDLARWQGEVSGKVEGALNVLFSLELDKEKRIELLRNAVGLSYATALEFVAPRQIEENIFKHPKLSAEEKNNLSKLMENDTMDDETIMDHPVEVLNFLASMNGELMIKKCIPQVKKWVDSGEDVSMRRIKDWYIEKYKLL